MKLLQPSLSLLSCAIAVATAEDVLLSERSLNKRFIDAQGNYNISFFHINDVHSHLDEFRSTGTDCVSQAAGCFGGYARVSQKIKDIRPGLQDSLFLNVGDEFQVSFGIWYLAYSRNMHGMGLIDFREPFSTASTAVRKLPRPSTSSASTA